MTEMRLAPQQGGDDWMAAQWLRSKETDTGTIMQSWTPRKLVLLRIGFEWTGLAGTLL